MSTEHDLAVQTRDVAIASLRMAAESANYVAAALDYLDSRDPDAVTSDLTVEDLYDDHVPALEPVRAPKEAPHPALFHFDWEALRAKVILAAGMEGIKFGIIGKRIGVPGDTMAAFARGSRHWMTVENTLKVMLWLGYTEFIEFGRDADDV